MLREKDLDFYVASDTVLLITTADVAKIAGTVQVYYVRDLLEKRTAENDSPGPCADDLIAMITSCVAPTTWDSTGGPGSINYELDSLAIRQTEPVHEQIAALLAALRQVRNSPGSTTPIAVGAPQDLHAAVAIETILAQRQQGFHRATDMKLTELRDSLESQGIPTLLDIRALIDSSVPPDVTLLDCNLKQVRFDWALRWLLKQRDLDYYVDGEVLVITTADKAKTANCTVVYPIGDLTETGRSGSAVDANVPDYDEVMNTITSTVAPNSWDSAGGNGSIAMLPAAKALVCSQTDEIQQQVAQMLADLRARIAAHKAVAEKPAESPAAPVVRVYFLKPPAAATADVPAKGAAVNAPVKETAAKEPTVKEAATNDARAATLHCRRQRLSSNRKAGPTAAAISPACRAPSSCGRRRKCKSASEPYW